MSVRGWVQAKDELMMHEDAVLALTWSKDSEMLATADQVTPPPAHSRVPVRPSARPQPAPAPRRRRSPCPAFRVSPGHSPPPHAHRALSPWSPHARAGASAPPRPRGCPRGTATSESPERSPPRASPPSTAARTGLAARTAPLHARPRV